MAISSRMLSLFLLILASSSTTAVLAFSSDQDDDNLTHIHIYVHETFKGANATTATVVASPRGADSTFGSVQVFDDELRVGQDRASELIGRFQGLVVGTSIEGGANYLSSLTCVFTGGEYAGSTLSVEGAVLGFNATVERPVVGGTGEFRMARGYSLFKVLSKPTSETVLFEVDLFVLMYRGQY